MWYDNEISMGILERKYLHKGEKPEQFISRVASIFSDELKPKAKKVLEDADFLPAGRTLFGAGYKGERKVSMSNCYVLPTPEDNIESIFDTAKMIARISSYGGGCGLAIDNLRPKDAPVNNSAMTSTGAVSFLNIFDVTGGTIGQNGRRAALMVGLRCDHPDIEEFLRIKQDGSKLASMNISIKFTNEFMEAVEKNQPFKLTYDSPETGHIEKTIDARSFFREFCETQWDWGDPGAIFIDRVRNFNLLSGYPEYKIDVSNPCAEFFGNGGNSCNLGSINIYNVIKDKFTDHAAVDEDHLREVTDTAVRMLDEILDYGYDMQPLDLNRETIADWRSIGLGVFGLADAFVAMGIRYGSEKSRWVAAEIMEIIMQQALMTSASLAAEKGAFRKFDIEKTLESPVIKAFPEVRHLIELAGLRNGTLLSIAPTGTISLFAGGFTGGIEPMYKIAYQRTSHSMEDSGKTFTVYARGVADLLKYHGCEDISPEEAKERFPFLIESHEVPPMERVAFQGIMQDYVDNAISSTVNLPNSATVEEIEEIYMTAWKQGLKGITVFRDGCKRGNILGVSDKPQEEVAPPDYDTIEPKESRREIKIVDGSTVREQTSCVSSMYVTTNKTLDGHVFEVFTNPSGGCKSNINTITRLISLALRSGVKVKKIIDELRANKCPACQVLRRQGKDVSLSCSNAIADAMELSMGRKLIAPAEPMRKTVGEMPQDDGLRECPECHKHTLRPEAKCWTCDNCGYNACE